MKNTLENKAKFFAQYWGQNVLCYYFRDGVCEREKVELDYPIQECIDNYKDAKLELKPLSQISDEDALILLKLALPEYSDNFTKFPKIEISKKEIKIDVYDNFGTYLEISGHGVRYLNWMEVSFFCNVVDVIDKIRDLGYAYTWNGITVEEQIEFGWIKLKE